MEKWEPESDMNKMDEMLPGFRFHPTDEELVGFYLKRMIQHRTLPIEVIKQVDIYKYDPWDLPKLACSGEKEWYFYCPRDRKYRNSARPNRVTMAGFWKATGTDRPIYSSNSNECIGLKKSLVFYRGRAAKGIKTDWMMHEFRLPSSATSASLTKNVSDKTQPPNDLWAICRIFKKTNTIMQRAIARSFLSQIHAPISYTTETSSLIQFPNNSPNQFNSNSNSSFCFPFSTEYISPPDTSKNMGNIASVPSNFEEKRQPISGFSIDPLEDKKVFDWGNMDSAGFSLSSSSNVLDTWNGDFIWDTLTCPSDTSATFSTNLCNS